MGPAGRFPRLADDPEARPARPAHVARAVPGADHEAVPAGLQRLLVEPPPEPHRADAGEACLRVAALHRDPPAAARAGAVAALLGELAAADAAEVLVPLDGDRDPRGLIEQPAQRRADREGRGERAAAAGGGKARGAELGLAHEGGGG